MTGCPQIYFVFGNRRSGKNLFSEIVPRQNVQIVIILDDRHDASHGGSDNLIARNNGGCGLLPRSPDSFAEEFFTGRCL